MEVAATLIDEEALRSAANKIWESDLEFDERRDALRALRGQFVGKLGGETVSEIMKEVATARSLHRRK